jgi:hypothetical protein
MKLSQFISAAFWASVIVCSWLLILRSIPSDGISWGFLAFFFLVALFSGSG